MTVSAAPTTRGPLRPDPSANVSVSARASPAISPDAATSAMRNAAKNGRAFMVIPTSILLLRLLVDMELDAPVLLPSFFGRVRGHRLVGPETFARQPGRGDPHRRQPLDHRGGAVGAELLVHRGGALVVGVSFDAHLRDLG